MYCYKYLCKKDIFLPNQRFMNLNIAIRKLCNQNRYHPVVINSNLFSIKCQSSENKNGTLF